MKPESEFGKKSRNKDGLNRYCKLCDRRMNNAAYSRWRNTRMKYKTTSKRAAYEFILEYLKDKACKHCGESDPIVLEFHHRDPFEKHLAIAQMVAYCYTLETIKAEVAKCDILCANCHKRITAHEQNNYKVRYSNVGIGTGGV